MRTLDKDLLIENIEKRINNDLDLHIISGASVVVNQNGETVYKKCFGKKSPDNDNQLDENTIFRLASMTKPVTAVATMILCDSGMLKLDDTVEKFLPSYKELYVAKLDENGNFIKENKTSVRPTIKHLLTHTSGIGSSNIGDLQYSAMTESDKCTLKNTVDYYSSQLLAFEPFSQECYSPVAAFDVLARIIEIVSESEYGDFLKNKIFNPCDMTDTAFVPTDEQWNRMVGMHDRQGGNSYVGTTTPGCVFEKFPCTHPLGGAGLISTISDYSNFAEMLLNKGEFRGNRIISENAVKLISLAHVPQTIQPGYQQWGLGVRVITGDYTLPVGSFGWSGAYGTHFWVDPKNKITAVYMKNSRYDGGSGAVTAANFETDVYNSLI